MAENDPRSLPVFPSVIFIVAPILGITALLCWATIENRRGFGMRRHLNRMGAANRLSEEDAPTMHEIWIQNNLKVTEDKSEERDRQTRIGDAAGELGDSRSLCKLIQRPLALRGVIAGVTDTNSAEDNTLATLIHMPHNPIIIKNASRGGSANDGHIEVLVGTSSVRFADTGVSAKSKT